jgi:thiamine-monophosphate kinase
VFGLTAVGRSAEKVPLRSGGNPGDGLWLVGTLGDAAAGLEMLRGDKNATGSLVDIYRRPVPLLAAGEALAVHASAMMDVSDGLLLDASRLAEASGLAAIIDLDALPLSEAFIRHKGVGREARLFAATGGDDYALLAALEAGTDPLRLSLPQGTTIACIGRLAAGGPRLSLVSGGIPVPLPERLGFEHSGLDQRGIDDGGNPPAPVADRN